MGGLAGAEPRDGVVTTPEAHTGALDSAPEEQHLGHSVSGRFSRVGVSAQQP